MHVRSLFCALLFCALLFSSACFVSCGGDAEPERVSSTAASSVLGDSAPRCVTLDWQKSARQGDDPAASAPPVNKPRVMASFAPTEGSRPWRAFSPGGTKDLELPSSTQGTAPRWATILPGLGEDKRLEIDLPDLEEAFNEVVVELEVFARKADYLVVEALSEGQVVALSDEVKLGSKPGLQTIIVPLAGTGGMDQIPDGVTIRLAADKQDMVAVSRVALLRRDWSEFLPDLDSPSVQLSGDHYREAVAVRADQPVEASFDVLGDDPGGLSQGARLDFSVAQAPELTKEGQRLAVEVSWLRGDEVLKSAVLDFGASGGLQKEVDWSDCSQGLAEFGAGPLTVRAKLLPSPDGAARTEYALFTRPTLAYPAPNPAAAPQTIVLITSDTHRADHIGLSGDEPLVFTPALDDLGKGGVQFLNCYSSTNVTTPSHAALMTGSHPRDLQIVTNRVRLADQASTLAEQFQAAGYMTLAVTSVAHLMDPTSGLGQGFHRMEGPVLEPRDAEASVGRAMDWLAEAEGLPVFLWLHLFDAHDPYAPPEPFRGKYYPEDKDPRDPAREWGLPESQTPGWIRDVTDVDYFYTQYRAEIDYLDSEIAKLLDAQRVRDGIVAFTSDHGENFGEHSVWFSHGGLYPSTLHVPLLMRWPGCPKNVQSNAPVRQIDVGRTLLNLAGMEGVEHPGRDLRWGLDEPTAANPRFFLSSHALEAGIEADGWLLNLSLKSHNLMRSSIRRPLGRVELFHIADDPAGVVDVLQDNLERGKKLRARLIEWLGSSEGAGLAADANVSAEMEALLNELGYAQSETEASTTWWRPEELDDAWDSNPWRELFEE